MKLENTWLLARADLKNTAELYADWTWLVVTVQLTKPLAISTFGDLFFQTENGVMLLDTLEGTVAVFAANENEMWQKLADEKNQKEFLLSDLVTTLREQKQVLDTDQLYLFQTPIALGGQAVSDNVKITTARLAISLTGQLHRQLSRRRT